MPKEPKFPTKQSSELSKEFLAAEVDGGERFRVLLHKKGMKHHRD